jgi:hypothetical protein
MRSEKARREYGTGNAQQRCVRKYAVEMRNGNAKRKRSGNAAEAIRQRLPGKTNTGASKLRFCFVSLFSVRLRASPGPFFSRQIGQTAALHADRLPVPVMQKTV